jgi:hypothetical protein
MPGNVKSALAKRNLMDAYLERPAYQKDDYLKWIGVGAGPTEKQKRIDQMLEELEKGGVFKGEPWTPPAKVEAAAKPANAKAEKTAKPAASKVISKPGSAPAKPVPAKPAPAKPGSAPAKPGNAPAKPGNAPAKPAAK